MPDPRPIAAAVLICLIGTPAANAAPPRHNVLFLAVDDLKPTLGCYGDPVALTPAIDRLAAGSTVFRNAHCQWPVCGPTRASLMTGLRPEAVGVLDLKTSMRAKNPDVLTLPQHFRGQGYATAGVGKIYDPRSVDDKKTLDEPSWSIPFVLPNHSELEHRKVERFALTPEVADGDLIDGQIAEQGLELLRGLAGSAEPFFLAVGFKKPHLPFVAPQKYWDLYDRDRLDLAGFRGGIENDSGYTLHDGPEFRGYGGVPVSGPIPEAVQREAIHGYYACTSYIDTQVGRLLTELDRLGLADTTTVVLWGDHGFHLGDHGMWGKHSTLEQATRVPLLFRPAGGTAVRDAPAPVEFVDLFPTLCDLAGLPVPASLHGRSLVPILDGSADRVRDGALTVFKSRGSLGYSYRTDRYRLTLWVNKRGKVAATELYDYGADPLETTNVAGDPAYAAVAAELRSKLLADSAGCERLRMLE